MVTKLLFPLEDDKNDQTFLDGDGQDHLNHHPMVGMIFHNHHLWKFHL
jgi:hypothetical protein